MLQREQEVLFENYLDLQKSMLELLLLELLLLQLLLLHLVHLFLQTVLRRGRPVVIRVRRMFEVVVVMVVVSMVEVAAVVEVSWVQHSPECRRC